MKRSLAIALTATMLGAGFVGCRDSHEAHDHGPGGHSHDHEAEDAHDHDAPKTDSHHVAESRTDCHDDVTLPEGAAERYGIVVEPVREMQLTPKVSAPGHLAFPQAAVARVGSAVSGRVVEIRVRSGDAVAKGDTLLVVESPALGEAQSEYLQKQTIAKTAEPAVEFARRALERAKELYERVQGIALADVQKREAELKAAERDREVARAASAAAFHRLRLLGLDDASIRELESNGTVEPRFAIRAPIDGKIVEISTTLGELVGPEKDRLVVVGDLRTLWAIAEVSESRLAEVALGAAARVNVPALANKSFTGKVAAIPTVLEAGTRTAEVRIDVPNDGGEMLPGMFIQVEIDSKLGDGKHVLAVPDAAVLTIEGQPSVFVPVDPDGNVFCKHAIEVGAAIGEHLPVLSGLQRGELIVVAGTFRLKAEHGKASAKHEH